jgi:hypothetical protein
LSVSNGEIVGGSIVHCSLDAARSPTATHETGHTFGLRHSPEPSELMAAVFTSARSASCGPRERLAMRLMLQRAGGNRFPDEDRSVQPTATAVEVTVCR